MNSARYEYMGKLREKYGNVGPDILIADARKNKKSPFYEEFNWDVESAAMDSWRQTARKIIREFHFEVQRRELHLLCPMFVRDPTQGKQQGYVMMPEAEKEKKRPIVLSQLAIAHGACNGAWLRITAMEFDEDEQELAEIESQMADIVERLHFMLQSVQKPEEESKAAEG